MLQCCSAPSHTSSLRCSCGSRGNHRQRILIEMRCWSFPRRVRANGNGGVGGAGGGNNDYRYRRLGRVAALEAGLTLVESADDETTNVLAIIIYDYDAIYDAIEVAATLSPHDDADDAVTDATMCSDLSWGGEEEDDDEGATSAAVDAAIDDSRDLRRAVHDGADQAIDPVSGSVLPVAIPMERNDDLGACRRGRLLRTVTSNSAASRALICP